MIYSGDRILSTHAGTLPRPHDLRDFVTTKAAGTIKHPDLVAERLVRYANPIGRENVLAGTDCGLGTRVGHASVCWAKLEALSEGARRASIQLRNKAA